jgi:hypothetical protein
VASRESCWLEARGAGCQGAWITGSTRGYSSGSKRWLGRSLSLDGEDAEGEVADEPVVEAFVPVAWASTSWSAQRRRKVVLFRDGSPISSVSCGSSGWRPAWRWRVAT